MRVPTQELKKIGYLNAEVVGDRVVNVVPLWDGSGWHIWIPQPDGSLLKMRPSESSHSDYVAKEPARDDDLHLSFIEFMWKHASWEDVAVRVRALSEDVHNLAASMAKIDHAFECRKAIGHGVGKFVATEVEYVFGVCRSLFDLLQEIVAAVWERIELVDPELQRSKRRLPLSFARLSLHGDRLMTVDEITAKFYRSPAAPLEAPALRCSLAERQTCRDSGLVQSILYDTDLHLLAAPARRPCCRDRKRSVPARQRQLSSRPWGRHTQPGSQS